MNRFWSRWNAVSWIRTDTLALFLLGLLCLLGVTVISNPLQRGMTVSYYDNPEWKGTPLLTLRERGVGLSRMQRVLPNIDRNYSVVWTGAIRVPESGTYTFTTVSDDGSALYLDDQLIVDNRGFHGLQERTGEIPLSRGFHRLTLRYMQGGGSAVFRAYWTRPGHDRAPLSASPLFVTAASRNAYRFGYVCEIINKITKITCSLLILVWILGGFLRGTLPVPRLHPAALAGIIFLFVFISHFFWSPITTSFDSRWSVHTTLSLLREGNTDLDEYRSIIERYPDHTIEQREGHLYTMYPVGTSLLALPFVLVIDQILARGFSIDFEQFLNQYYLIPGGVETFAAAGIVALAAVFFYLFAEFYSHNRRHALILTVIFAYGTSVWSTASRALWQHGPSVLMTTLALYLVMLAQEKPRYAPWAIRLLGVILAFSFVIRPTNSASILWWTLFVFIRYRSLAGSYCLWSCFVSLPFFMFNLSVYHAILPPYYLHGGQLGGEHLLEGLLGTLISPSRGVFVFSPILLFALYGVYLRLKSRRFTWIDGTLLLILGVHWFLSSAHPHWWGGHCYGPRYFTEITPYFLYFLFPVLSRLGRGRNRGLAVLVWITIVISVSIHYRGASSEAAYGWNAGPVNVDQDPSRVWNWRDSQFLRGF